MFSFKKEKLLQAEVPPSSLSSMNLCTFELEKTSETRGNNSHLQSHGPSPDDLLVFELMFVFHTQGGKDLLKQTNLSSLCIK